VTAGIEEKEPEIGRRRDRFGHHGNEQRTMPARLEAETGAYVIQVFLKPPALLGDRAARQSAEPTRHQAHADARRMEVDRPDQACRSHRSHLPFCHETASHTGVSRPGAPRPVTRQRVNGVTTKPSRRAAATSRSSSETKASVDGRASAT